MGLPGLSVVRALSWGGVGAALSPLMLFPLWLGWSRALSMKFWNTLYSRVGPDGRGARWPEVLPWFWPVPLPPRPVFREREHHSPGVTLCFLQALKPLENGTGVWGSEEALGPCPVQIGSPLTPAELA